MSTIVYVTPQYPRVTLTPYRSLVRTVQPASEPVTLAEAKAHLRVDTSDDDVYITSLISVAREYCEERLDTTFITSTWQAKYDEFPIWDLILPRPPMLSGNVTVAYRNPEGAVSSLTSAASEFQVDAAAVPGRIFPLYSTTWPSVRGDENSVSVTWQAGYGSSGSDVPAIARHAMLLLIGAWFGSREPMTAGMTAQNLPIPYTFETLISMSGWGGYR